MGATGGAFREDTDFRGPGPICGTTFHPHPRPARQFRLKLLSTKPGPTPTKFLTSLTNLGKVDTFAHFRPNPAALNHCVVCEARFVPEQLMHRRFLPIERQRAASRSSAGDKGGDMTAMCSRRLARACTGRRRGADG